MSVIGKSLNKLFVSAKILGDEQLRIGEDVIYVLETSRSEHTALLVLSLKEQGVVASRRDLLSVDKKTARAMQFRLESLIEKLEFKGEDADIKIVPVTIYHGHFPGRSSSWWRVVFSERWGPKGWWGRLLQLMVSGRQTLLQLDQPFSLRALMNDSNSQLAGVTAASVVNVLEEHFVQRRRATFGPDLSNRKQLLEAIIDQDDVQREIQLHSEQQQQSFEKSEKFARHQINAIAANVSPSFIRMLSSALGWFFSRIYRSVKVKGVDKISTG